MYQYDKAGAFAVGTFIGCVIVAAGLGGGVWVHSVCVERLSEFLSQAFATLAGVAVMSALTTGIVLTLDVLRDRENRRRNGAGGGRG